MMVDNPMQEDRLVVPSSEVRGSGANGLWVDRAGRHGMDTVDMCRVVSGVVLRTLATRGRKRAGPTSEAQWEGWSEAEGPKDNTACGNPIPAYPITPNREATEKGASFLCPRVRHI